MFSRSPQRTSGHGCKWYVLTAFSFAAVQVVFVGQALEDGPKRFMPASNSTFVNNTCQC